MLYWIIENKEQLTSFNEKGYKEVFLEPILFNDNIHSVLNDVSLLYIKPINGDKGFMLCLKHDETFSLEKSYIEETLKSFDKIYIRDKKLLLSYFTNFNYIDISFNYNDDINETTNTHDFFYQKYYSNPCLNTIIPIVKHYEKCEMIWNKVNKYCTGEKNQYLNRLSTVFYIIENNGIRINEDLFNKFFEPNEYKFNIQNNTIYTHYNLNTLTGRPSNSFNGINFAALKKNTGERKCFIPKNDYFLEYDLTAYHPSLLAKIINFDFKSETPYEYFSREANIPLSDAKLEMIKQMYGGVFDKYLYIPFFNELNNYTNSIWDKFINEGYYKCEWSGKIFNKEFLSEMTPGKLLSYIIQNLETWNNVNIMWDILKILNSNNTQLILYTYDSFLLDVDENESDLIYKIENIFNKFNLKTKKQQGINYDFKNKL